MIIISCLVAYYLIGTATAAWLSKTYPSIDHQDPALKHVMIPLFWPLVALMFIMRIICKIHMMIYTVMSHALSVFNMRITKDGSDTVIRFHVPKKAELSAKDN